MASQYMLRESYHIQAMIFERILSVFKSGGKFKAPAFAPPEPANEFTHPENQPLFARLRENSRVAAPDKDPLRVIGRYEARAHPDLVSILYDLIDSNEVRKGSAYGRPVMANRQGVVFAYAGGTHYIFLKLREERHEAARRDGGRFDPTYGRDWIEFRLGGRVEDQVDWKEATRRWCRISFQESLTAKS
jgi:hypothetical protein